MQEKPTALGYAPDSVYASWTEAEREMSDRMEDQSNNHRARDAELARQESHNHLFGFSDDALRRLRKHYLRDIEDIEDGESVLFSPTSKTANGTLRLLRAKLHDVEVLQETRKALATSWLATDNGTRCYSSFIARGGLKAVRDNGARPAHYSLAQILDWERWKQGTAHVLAWKEDAA